MPRSHDPKCRELADYFLSAERDELKAALAQHIQDAIEEWLEAHAADERSA